MSVINALRRLPFAAVLFVACTDPGGGSGGGGGGAGEAASGDAGVSGSAGAAGGNQHAGASQGGEATAADGGSNSDAGQSGHGGDGGLAGENGAAGLAGDSGGGGAATAGDAGAAGDAGGAGDAGVGGEGGFDVGGADAGGAPGSGGSGAGNSGVGGGAGSDACDGEQRLGGAPLFSVEYPSSHHLLADLNGDDHADLVLLTHDEVSVRLGNGQGSFGPATLYAVGLPTRAAAADLNADGNLDLAVANEAGSVSVLLGFGDGTFASGIEYALPQYPVDLVAGDWNGDGSVDLAFIHAGNDSVSIVLNLGDGSLAAAETFVAGPSPVQITSADFNGDGSLDLAVGVYGLGLPQFGNVVRIHENDGTGHFTEGPSFVPGELGMTLGAADLNDDGVADILVVDGLNTPNFWVVLSDGAGGFEPPVAYAARVTPASLASADLDNDGDTDVLALSHRNAALSVFLNDGEGRLVLTSEYSAGPDAGWVGTGDLNADGLPDVTVTGKFTRTLLVMINRGHGLLAAGRSYRTAPSEPYDGAAADFDGDGDLDLAIALLFGGISISLNDGAGVFGEPSGYATNQYTSAVVPADFNGDGYPDLAFAADAGFGIVLNLGDGTFGDALLLGDKATWSLTAGDLDDDGSADVVRGDASGILVYYGRSDGTFDAPVNYALTAEPSHLAMTDLDGDGLRELVGVSNETIHVLANRGSRRFFPRSYPVAPGAQRMAIADFDGADGVDIVAQRYAGSTFSILLNRGDGTFDAAADQAAVLRNSIVVAGDFTGDGHVDLMTSGNPDDPVVTLLANDGHAVFSASQRFGAGLNLVSLVPADLDGNGMLDLVVANRAGDMTVLISECAE